VEKENRDNKQRTIFEMLWGGPGGIGSWNRWGYRVLNTQNASAHSDDNMGDHRPELCAWPVISFSPTFFAPS
jgi:hypothetical protein